ncbi:MAG: aldo/keto reductase [Clostridiaceae bacterium]|nr:aldo/keto reductase [Clostridiaceae bacterium]
MQNIKFHNNVEMPLVGLGVYKIEDEMMDQVIESAYANGYRHFDTAQMYHNEKSLGRACKRLNVPREELLITTKIDNLNQGYEKTLKSFKQSCQDLQVDYVDQLLIHWPGQNPQRTAETWKAFEKLYEERLVRVIGLSNFTLKHIAIIEKTGNIKPMSNQIERNPLITQSELIPALQTKNIVPIAWAPLRRGNFLSDVIIKIAEKYNKTPAQIVLRWNIESNVIVIPRSKNPIRQSENMEIFDFELTESEIEAINALHTGERTSFDPVTFDF